MTNEKHFSYEMDSPVSPSPEIKDIVFLTPAKITYENGQEMVSVDLINQKVYNQKGEETDSVKFFEFMRSENDVPDDFFSVPSDTYQSAQNMLDEHSRMKEEHQPEGDI